MFDSHYTKNKDNRQTKLSEEQINAVVDLAIALQDIQKVFSTISIPTIAEKIAGLTKQGLHYQMKKRRGEVK